MPENAARGATNDRAIFLNCPFDEAYRPIFDALVFAAFDCGHVPRCALEFDDSGETRLEKIIGLIGDCPFGVHDISRTELDDRHGLPRFNMPFELGLFMGAARFGEEQQKRKVCLVLDREPYRFQKFLSDIAGQDIKAHGDDPATAIGALRAWLATLCKRDLLPGGTSIHGRYVEFRRQLPELLRSLHIAPDEMVFNDYTNIVSEWLRLNPRA